METVWVGIPGLAVQPPGASMPTGQTELVDVEDIEDVVLEPRVVVV